MGVDRILLRQGGSFRISWIFNFNRGCPRWTLKKGGSTYSVAIMRHKVSFPLVCPAAMRRAFFLCRNIMFGEISRLRSVKGKDS